MIAERIAKIQLLVHRVKASLEAPDADKIRTETRDKTIECLRRISLRLDQEHGGEALDSRSYYHEMTELSALAVQISLELNGGDT